MEKLLGTNTKLEKNFGKAADYIVTGLTMAPHTLSGYNVCDWSTLGCRASCVLWFAGRRVMEPIRQKAIRVAKLFFEQRDEFQAQLSKEIEAFIKKAKKESLIPAIRLNVASDLDWSNVAAKYDNAVFYDYTKSRARFTEYLRGNWPSNYDLTFSASEHTNSVILRQFLNQGGNVAQVFDTRYVNRNNQDALPTSVEYDGETFEVIDADKHDVRLQVVDGRSKMCGLRLKGTIKAKERARKSKFAIEGNYATVH